MRIGVQLPDGLKRKAIEICENIDGDVILSGDSCFGACDIDLNLLQDVDALYHYGHTEILKIDKVVYIPLTVDFEIEKVAETLKKIPERKIALISTAQYCHKLPNLKAVLEELGFEVELKKGDRRVKLLGQILGCDYSALRQTSSEAVVFIGDGIFHARGASIYSGRKVYALNPLNFELREVKVEEFIRERYFQISRCVGLEKMGIIVSTKPGQKRLKLAEEIKKRARKSGFKAILVYVNDITPEKLENLPFEFYVNTACPRISYDDYKRYSKPIITPTEFEILIGLKKELEVDEMS